MSLIAEWPAVVEFELFEYVDRPIYLGSLPSLAAWPEARPAPLADFALLLLLDAANLPDAEIRKFAKASLSQGLKYLCVWGPDCKRVHDVFDEVLAETPIVDAQGARFDWQSVMTTWHTQSLDEAVFYFLNNAGPCGQPTDASDSWAIVAVGHPQWADQVRDRLAHPGGRWLDDYLRSGE